MHSDLASQMRPRLSEPVRSIGDAAHHRLSLLGTAPPLQRSSLAILIRASSPLVLSCKLVRCLFDPSLPTGAVTQPSSHCWPPSKPSWRGKVSKACPWTGSPGRPAPAWALVYRRFRNLSGLALALLDDR
jgi:hypothetical protein